MNFYIVVQIITSTIAATSVMTLFSYAVSASARELYKEPVLLGYILKVFGIEVKLPVRITLGWILHYLIGLTFVIAYHFLWTYKIFEMSWSTALLFGAISGIIGIISWIIMFASAPKKPDINLPGYYTQLFVAHVIFAIVAFVVYKLFL